MNEKVDVNISKLKRRVEVEPSNSEFLFQLGDNPEFESFRNADESEKNSVFLKIINYISN